MAAGTQPSEQSSATSSAGPSVKLFLGGLSWQTDEDKLKTHFDKFGDVVDAVVMRDRATGQPRGFGFVTFKDSEAAASACKEAHSIDGRTIDAKPSVPQSEGQRPRSRKIFVGGLAPELTGEQFKEHFQQFGSVAEVNIMMDHNSGRSRGFGFVTFEEEDSVNEILRKGSMHVLLGKQVEVKCATPKGSGPLPPALQQRVPPTWDVGAGWGPHQPHRSQRGPSPALQQQHQQMQLQMQMQQQQQLQQQPASGGRGVWGQDGGPGGGGGGAAGAGGRVPAGGSHPQAGGLGGGPGGVVAVVGGRSGGGRVAAAAPGFEGGAVAPPFGGGIVAGQQQGYGAVGGYGFGMPMAPYGYGMYGGYPPHGMMMGMYGGYAGAPPYGPMYAGQYGQQQQQQQHYAGHRKQPVAQQ